MPGDIRLTFTLCGATDCLTTTEGRHGKLDQRHGSDGVDRSLDMIESSALFRRRRLERGEE
jgi:hypothetical protein